jgi:hypothetical protein
MTFGVSELFIAESKTKVEAHRALVAQQEAEQVAWNVFWEGLNRARTKADLVATLGGLPQRCEKVSETQEGCEWQLGQNRWQTLEGPVVAVPIGQAWMATRPPPMTVQTSHAVRVTCLLPLDGSPRNPGSCRAQKE